MELLLYENSYINLSAPSKIKSQVNIHRL